MARLAEGFNPALRDWVSYLIAVPNPFHPSHPCSKGEGMSGASLGGMLIVLVPAAHEKLRSDKLAAARARQSPTSPPAAQALSRAEARLANSERPLLQARARRVRARKAPS